MATVATNGQQTPPFVPYLRENEPVPFCQQPKEPPEVLVNQDALLLTLSSKDLEILHRQLWYAGRVGNISPLHHQRVLRRDIILTELPRLHLVWLKRVIYIQPLPTCLLNWSFFSNVICGNAVLHQACVGFLLGYMRLVTYPSDLELAKSLGLIRAKIKWRKWESFRADVLHHLNNREMHDRFEYGELRLNRLDTLYRLRFMGLSYFNTHRYYESYFGENIGILISLFALVSVALSAMQVLIGVSTRPQAVTTTAYRFSIAALIFLAASCAVLLAVYTGMVVANWVLIFARRKRTGTT